MGARVGRMFRNFNLENRAHREVGRAKPVPAPRHQGPGKPVGGTEDVPEKIRQKDESLASLLKSVYVESTEPVPPTPLPAAAERAEVQRRPLKAALPGDPYGICDITDVPKGKLSIVEALTALNNHKREPRTWTAEKVAQEYSLDLAETKALVQFFIPFDVKMIPPNSAGAKQIKGS
ncbi:NADH dehydrogenase [ubiquinone] 1 alpha subcomplex assembly factor 4 isoform X2 [Denticeps clupeoides]|uniref:NADH dehydrogenase [ubiquinone] 1 alpha subcomplex assembly factor 4 isoform X2 n=1 Tax=Denticeps clupeoides TaxID=299321 RepID=UPI0010A51350|nr:NADH dehydrogenase [ubiquinone] 1 alpha subcomplex assembly factor 4 isoform X2 [Denticeps clupeoides]